MYKPFCCSLLCINSALNQQIFDVSQQEIVHSSDGSIFRRVSALYPRLHTHTHTHTRDHVILVEQLAVLFVKGGMPLQVAETHVRTGSCKEHYDATGIVL